uniref:Uncharacterized protein n=1 Tax=Avena sativa TaxID=4498 RepID=A0ACD5X062_AVESA
MMHRCLAWISIAPVEDEDVPSAEPLFCSQAGLIENVAESPNPVVDGRGVLICNSDEHSGRGPQRNGVPPAAANHSISPASFPTESTTYPDLAEEVVDGDGMNEEVVSSPQEPFLGMHFDTLQSARAHYNAYAPKLGFSIKAHTSQKEKNMDDVIKKQFVCNKFRRPKTEEEEQRDWMTIVEQVSPVQLDDADVEGDGSGTSRKSSGKIGGKRKRKSIKQTKCPARMFVKLIKNKWQVTYFIAEHNHPLIERPSLTKYLRSHRGIPVTRRNF